MSNLYGYNDATVSTFRSPDFFFSYPLGSSTPKVVDTFKLVFVPRFNEVSSLNSSEQADVLAQRVNLVDSVGLLAESPKLVQSVALSSFTGANDAAKQSRRDSASAAAHALVLGLASALIADSSALNSLGAADPSTVVSDVLGLISNNTTWS